MYLHTPAVEAGSWWRVDTASGSDTGTTVYAYDGTGPIPNYYVLTGSTVRNTSWDGTARFWSATQTLYLKELTYQGAPNGTVVTSTGVTPAAPVGGAPVDIATISVAVAALPTTYAQLTPLLYGVQMEVRGHSFVTDPGARCTSGREYFKQIRDALGLGTTTGLGHGGYRCQSIAMRALATANQVTDTITVASKKIYLIDAILNDVEIYGNDTAAIKAAQHGLRVMTDRARAATFYDVTDGSMAFVGTWAAAFSGSVGPDGAKQTTRWTATVNDTVTITTRALVAGETAVSVLIFGNAQAASQVGVQVDGGTETFVDIGAQCTNVGANGGGAQLPDAYCQMRVRVTGLSTGAHTVRLRYSLHPGSPASLNTQGYFIESTTPPPVFYIKPLAINQAWSANSSPYNAGSDAALAAFRAAVDVVAAEYSSNVFVLDAVAAWTLSRDVSSVDKVHPNDAGMNTLAHAYAGQIAAALTYGNTGLFAI